jgi:hypothetical protein
MTTDPRGNTAQRRRWALWLFVFAGFVLHAGLCPPNAHAGAPGTTVRACASSPDGAPPPADASTPPDEPEPASRRTGEGGHPCAPPLHPHRHAPCAEANHRGYSPGRSTWPCPGATPPRCPPPAERPDAAGPRARAGDHSSRPAFPSSGVSLLTGLCSSRT